LVTFPWCAQSSFRSPFSLLLYFVISFVYLTTFDLSWHATFFVFSVLLGRPCGIRSSNISFEINYKGSVWGLTKWSSKWSQYVLIFPDFFFLHNGRDISVGLCIIWSTYTNLVKLWYNIKVAQWSRPNMIKQVSALALPGCLSTYFDLTFRSAKIPHHASV
jgi:hypothetical protein